MLAEVPPTATAAVEPDWPLGGLVEDVVEPMAQVLARGRPCVLATLVGAEGSAPRPPGAQMLVREDGSHVGYVAGNCLESAVAAEAASLLAGDHRKSLILGAGSPFMDLKLPCGSRLEVLLERVDPDCVAAARLLRDLRERREAVWLSRLDEPERRCMALDVRPMEECALRAWTAATACAPDAGGRGGGWMWRRHRPPLRLFLVGGDPVVLAIARLAAASGYEVTVDRPKGPKSLPDGFAFSYDRRAPAEAARAAKVDRWTAVVAATHDLDDDHQALARALEADAFYVGALGSRRRVAARLQRLAVDGVDSWKMARLHAPVGLPIHAASPTEIAIAVLADVVAAWRRMDARR